MSDRLRPRPGDPVQLVLTLCHEIGNLLAAARLSAYLVGRDGAAEPVRASAEDIQTLCSQAGAALAHLRPLLTGSETRPVRVAPDEVLKAVGRSLARGGGYPPLVELTVEDALPDVEVDPDALHQLLVSLVLSAWDAAPEGCRVRLDALEEEGLLRFRIEDGGEPYRAEKVDPRIGPRGRALALEVAATVLEAWRGHVDVRSGEKGTRVDVCLPPAARAG